MAPFSYSSLLKEYCTECGQAGKTLKIFSMSPLRFQQGCVISSENMQSSGRQGGKRILIIIFCPLNYASVTALDF